MTCVFLLHRVSVSKDAVTHSTQVQIPLYRGEEAPCPYIQGKTELHAYAVFDKKELKPYSEEMNRVGFRRSMNTAYITICQGCRACQSVRVVVDDFRPSRSLRRVVRDSTDVRFCIEPSMYKEEHYALFRRYLARRHPQSDMNKTGAPYYARLVSVVPKDAFLLCAYDSADRLLAVTMVDDFDDGFSAVYSFFEPEQSKRSLGLMMIIELIRRAQETHKPYVYLGYYIAGVSNMTYKARFSPLERYDNATGSWNVMRV